STSVDMRVTWRRELVRRCAKRTCATAQPTKLEAAPDDIDGRDYEQREQRQRDEAAPHRRGNALRASDPVPLSSKMGSSPDTFVMPVMRSGLTRSAPASTDAWTRSSVVESVPLARPSFHASSR